MEYVMKKLLTNENLKHMGQGWLVWGLRRIRGTGMEQNLYVHSLRKEYKLDQGSFLSLKNVLVRHILNEGTFWSLMAH